MRRNSFLVGILPAFAPILLYIAVEAIWGETAGLVAGLALGLGEATVIFVRERRFDAFVLVDTALLVAMALGSLALGSPALFRLKPALGSLFMGIIMMAGVMGRRGFLFRYMEARMALPPMEDRLRRRSARMIAGFGILCVLYAGLCAYAAFFLPKSAWNFIAGALFWILALLYVLPWTLPALITRLRDKGRQGPRREGEGEYLPVVDKEGRVVGKAPRPDCHSGGGPSAPLHPVVRLWLRDSSGAYYLQRRALAKLVQPGKWDCAVGGHVSYGEDLETALAREAREEIGLEARLIKTLAAKPLARFVWCTELERELVHTFLAEMGDSPSFRVDPAEVSEIRPWTPEELVRELGLPEAQSRLTQLARLELSRILGLALAEGQAAEGRTAEGRANE